MKIIRNEKEAIEAIKSNYPASGYYMLIEALDIAISALEKQIPKKPILYSKKKAEIKEGDYIYVKCPSCGEYILSCFHYPPWNEIQKSHKYCENCGQKLDWSDADE